MRAGFSVQKRKSTEKSEKTTKEVKLALNQHASRQPFTSFRGALRWLSAR
jgi:hypothetical protein